MNPLGTAELTRLFVVRPLSGLGCGSELTLVGEGTETNILVVQLGAFVHNGGARLCPCRPVSNKAELPSAAW
jgi:hypothetical protein